MIFREIRPKMFPCFTIIFSVRATPVSTPMSQSFEERLRAVFYSSLGCLHSGFQPSRLASEDALGECVGAVRYESSGVVGDLCYA